MLPIRRGIVPDAPGRGESSPIGAEGRVIQEAAFVVAAEDLPARRDIPDAQPAERLLPVHPARIPTMVGQAGAVAAELDLLGAEKGRGVARWGGVGREEDLAG